MKTHFGVRGVAALAGAFSLLGMSNVAGAQVKHHGFLHRHKNATTAVAGVGAYKYAKSRKHGFMHRHPFLTGAAAGMAARHYAKKH